MEEMAYLVNLLWQHSEPVIFANFGRININMNNFRLGCNLFWRRNRSVAYTRATQQN